MIKQKSRILALVSKRCLWDIAALEYSAKISQEINPALKSADLIQKYSELVKPIIYSQSFSKQLFDFNLKVSKSNSLP